MCIYMMQEKHILYFAWDFIAVSAFFFQHHGQHIAIVSGLGCLVIRAEVQVKCRDQVHMICFHWMRGAGCLWILSLDGATFSPLYLCHSSIYVSTQSKNSHESKAEIFSFCFHGLYTFQPLSICLLTQTAHQSVALQHLNAFSHVDVVRTWNAVRESGRGIEEILKGCWCQTGLSESFRSCWSTWIFVHNHV